MSEVKKESTTDGDVQIKKILVPLDGSNCSMRAARYAIEASRLQRAQIFLIHIVTRIPYSYGPPRSILDEYFENVKDKAQAWFNNVIYMATKGWTQKSDDV